MNTVTPSSPVSPAPITLSPFTSVYLKPEMSNLSKLAKFSPSGQLPEVPVMA